MNNEFILTPFFLDQRRDTLRAAAADDWTINTPALPEGKMQARMSVYHEQLAELVAEAVLAGARPVSVAGDCCATIGVVAGLQRAGLDPVLLWLDAHGDFNTWETTPSGFLGGMPLAMLVGRGEQTMPRAVRVVPLDEEKVVLADARDLDAGEKVSLTQSQVRHVSDVRQLLLQVSDVQQKLADDRLNAPLYIHFDTDIVNPHDSPAQSYLAPGGPSADELRELFRLLAQTKNIVAISMCAWNPALDTDGKTQTVSMDLLQTLVGNDDS